MKYTFFVIFIFSFGLVNSVTTSVEPDYVYFSYNQTHETDYGDITSLVNSSDGINFSYSPIYNISFGGYCDGITNFDTNALNKTEFLKKENDESTGPLGASDWVHFNFSGVPEGNATLILRIDGHGSNDYNANISYCNGSSDRKGPLLTSFVALSGVNHYYYINLNINSSSPKASSGLC